MLFVLFQLGNHRYALEASRVVEVVPLLALNRFPSSPRGMAGLFIYHGQPVPALDLCELTLGRPARELLSTRILIVQHHKPGGDRQLIGLIAERATGTLRREEKEFVNAGANLAANTVPGPVLMDEQGIIQILDAQKLLDEGGFPLPLPPAPEGSHA